MTEITEKIKEIAANILQDKEMELVDIAYKREGPSMVLRLVVDKKGGVTIDECGWVNEKLGELLDKEDFMIGRYTLEVSSPGLDRPLKKKKDFEKVMGELVRVATYGPVEEKREHVGKVVSCDDIGVIIQLKDMEAERIIPLDMISRARLEIGF